AVAVSSPPARSPKPWRRSTRAASRRRSARRSRSSASDTGRPLDLGRAVGQIDELWRYDGRRAVVTGCASGIGEHVARQLTELGADVVGLDKRRPAFEANEFHEVDLADPEYIDRALGSIGGRGEQLVTDD